MANPPAIRINVMRSQLGRARGLGSAHAGLHHWLALRITSIALLPLTLWFVVEILRLAQAGQPQMLHWAHQPWNSVLLLAFIAATFHHLHLGLQAVIEDYVGVAARYTLLALMRFAVALLTLACLVSVLKLAL